MPTNEPTKDDCDPIDDAASGGRALARRLAKLKADTHALVRDFHRLAKAVDAHGQLATAVEVEMRRALGVAGVMLEAIETDLHPTDAELARSLVFLIVPTGDPRDPNLIGPFATWKAAEVFARRYEGAVVRTTMTPELGILCEQDADETAAWEKPHH